MKIIEPGHVYQLNELDLGEQRQSSQTLTFVNREPGTEHPGTQTQEVLRALIDRTYHCDNCMPHELNSFIIHHLRMALVYHEMRALERKAEKGYYQPELVGVDHDGHFALATGLPMDPLSAPHREFLLKPDQKVPHYDKT